MTSIDHSASGVPCRIDSFQPDPAAAVAFYGALLDWTFDPPLAHPGLGPIWNARLEGKVVASIGQAAEGQPTAAWTTAVSVGDVEATTALAETHGATVLLPPTPAAPDGRLSLLLDPTGAVIGLWEPGENAGAELKNVAGAWAMSALHTPSVDAAAAFYGAVLGWRLDQSTPGPLGLFRLPGHVRPHPEPGQPADLVAIVVPIGPGEPTPPHWSVGVLTTDLDATIARATALGGQVLFGPVDTPTTRSAAIADPQGGVLSLNQRR